MELSFTEKKSIRKNFGKLKETLSIPNLIEVQKKSYNQFLYPTGHTDSSLQKGLDKVFNSIFPIEELSDKATLELPAEVSGTITLKAEEGDAVEVGAVVCFIDTEGEATAGATTTASSAAPAAVTSAPKTPAPEQTSTYASQTPSPAARKIIA